MTDHIQSDMQAEDIRAVNSDTPADSASPSGRNATYSVEYTGDGVFLHAVYEDMGGRPLQADAVTHDLNRRHINSLNLGDVLVRIRRREERIRIADTQEESAADSDVMVVTARDQMSAEMMLFPPCGSGTALTGEALLTLIQKKWDITFGLDTDAITQAAENRLYYQWVHIASGKHPEKGEDGRVTFLFSTHHSYAPKIAEDGSADYKNLNIFESVKEGAAVVTATPPGAGVAGCTVKGTVLPPQKGLDVKLPKGKNVRVSEDGLSLIATKSGRVDYINARVEIADVYRIPGDADMSVGNVLFEGDVIIHGDVISGLTIEASGTIEVWGYVEAATLIAGKDIVLKNGMQGMDKGKLVAGGNVVSRFLERSEIEAKGSLFSDSIVQCKVIAHECIHMRGKWGRILGGVVRAGKEISANTIGSPANELTVVDLGASPELRMLYTKLDTEKNQIKLQLDRISNVAMTIPASSDSPERQEMRLKLINAKEQLLLQYNEKTAELEALTQNLSEHRGAKLHVFKSIYPNVKVNIDSCSMTTKTTIDYATFLYRDGEVVFTACEAHP
jgi:hypothetical protein